MIYTTHYMEEAERLCTRIAVIDAGTIIARGTPKELRAAHPDQKNLGDLFLHLTGRSLRD
jgi:ABC-2 type transport system ATP-binding protein